MPKPTYIDVIKCLVCDWTPDPTARASLDGQAGKHTTTTGHATVSGMRRA